MYQNAFTLPPVTPVVQGIKFGDRQFYEPRRFPSLLIPPTQGIYAILVSDATWTPRPFRVIYFGESNNLGNRISTAHEKYIDWTREAAGSQLYVAYHVTIGMTDAQRRDAECVLINQYQPVCNVRMDTPAAFKLFYGL
jgi:excinuclease UvrABC nuclease subunit